MGKRFVHTLLSNSNKLLLRFSNHSTTAARSDDNSYLDPAATQLSESPGPDQAATAAATETAAGGQGSAAHSGTVGQTAATTQTPGQ